MTQFETCEMPFGSAQRGQDSVCHLAKWWLCARCPEKHPRAQQGPGSCGAASLLCCAVLVWSLGCSQVWGSATRGQLCVGGIVQQLHLEMGFYPSACSALVQFQ